MNKQHSNQLSRSLGLWSAVAVIVGDMIGTGIFLVTGDMARLGSSVMVVFLAWIIGGVISTFGALCYAELGAAIPAAGGDYVYLSRAFGPLWGFLFGWMIAILERPASIAAITSGFLYFSTFLVPSLAAHSYSLPVPGVIHPFTLTISLTQLLAAVVIWCITIINYLGVRWGAEFQVGMTALKVLSVIALVVIGIGGHQQTSAQVAAGSTTHVANFNVTALLAVLVPAMWAYTGFGDLGHLGSEIRQPETNMPRAILISVFTVTVLYILVNAVYFHQFTFTQIANSRHVASDVVENILGRAGAIGLTIAMMVSALGSANAVIMTGARVPFAMARDGLFFRSMGRVQPIFHTPGAALVLQASLASFLVLTGKFDELYSLAVFALSLFFALTACALIYLRRKEPDLLRPYRTLGYPLVPLIFALVMISLSVNLLWTQPVRSFTGLLTIACGVPFYYYWQRAWQKQAP